MSQIDNKIILRTAALAVSGVLLWSAVKDIPAPEPEVPEYAIAEPESEVSEATEVIAEPEPEPETELDGFSEQAFVPSDELADTLQEEPGISLEATYIAVDDELAEEFPQLADTLQKENESRGLQLEEKLKTLIEAFGVDTVSLTYTEDAAVRRSDRKVFSILYSGYISGAEEIPAYYKEGLCYDTESGKRLLLSDIITDKETFAKAVSEQFAKSWPYLSVVHTPEEYFASTPEEELSWTLDYNGITCYFNPNALTAYNTGIQIVTLSFSDYPALFAADYAETPERYRTSLCQEDPFYFDLNGDGVLDELIVRAVAGSSGLYESLSIYINGESSAEALTNPTALLQIVFLYEDGAPYLEIQGESTEPLRLDLKK